MKNLIKFKSNRFLFSICFLLVTALGCTKEEMEEVIVGDVPHKTVPEPFTGDFAWSQVSSGGYNDAYGGYYSGLALGAQMHLNQNGTGTYVFRYDIHYANGGAKSVHIDSDVAYEIEKISADRMNMTIHFIRGKNYEDGHFLHDLDPSKIYPNGDFVWNNVPYGINAQGKIFFQPGPDLTFTKK
ncbi:hypothetical protein AHMF7605_27385 [Adhaeribacter arboris]|uniref:Uncharacterized protein n=1 Tax=Adhaeribacter arboris TaxID=2072846 RepID=A0A2T2YN60_9BACT|nr:hypothetical protein [Adhaeribacter arboris]PSR56952.1 hypothetical protein AHMF7605_27385 [Adhaeribacter arboris]